uniref:Uncharacterized protein n=1 Tax=Arundo donax TaxID=35708 RepID=A0A0A9BUY0_ARUDO
MTRLMGLQFNIVY